MKNIGYVIRLCGPVHSYAYGLNLKYAKVFSTREAARRDKRMHNEPGEKIFQVELTKVGRVKRIIKEMR